MKPRSVQESTRESASQALSRDREAPVQAQLPAQAGPATGTEESGLAPSQQLLGDTFAIGERAPAATTDGGAVVPAGPPGSLGFEEQDPPSVVARAERQALDETIEGLVARLASERWPAQVLRAELVRVLDPDGRALPPSPELVARVTQFVQRTSPMLGVPLLEGLGAWNRLGFEERPRSLHEQLVGAVQRQPVAPEVLTEAARLAISTVDPSGLRALVESAAFVQSDTNRQRWMLLSHRLTSDGALPEAAREAGRAFVADPAVVSSDPGALCHYAQELLHLSQPPGARLAEHLPVLLEVVRRLGPSSLLWRLPPQFDTALRNVLSVPADQPLLSAALTQHLHQALDELTSLLGGQLIATPCVAFHDRVNQSLRFKGLPSVAAFERNRGLVGAVPFVKEPAALLEVVGQAPEELLMYLEPTILSQRFLRDSVEGQLLRLRMAPAEARLSQALDRTEAAAWARLEGLLAQPALWSLDADVHQAFLDVALEAGPSERVVSTLVRAAQTRWLSAMSPDDQRLTGKVLAVLAAKANVATGTQRTVLLNTLEQLLTERVKLSLNNFPGAPNTTGRESGKGNIAVRRQHCREPLTSANLRYIALSTLPHEVNHVCNPTSNEVSYKYFMDEYRAFYVDWVSQNGKPPTNREAHRIVINLCKGTSYPNLTQAYEKSRDSDRIRRFIAHIVGHEDSWRPQLGYFPSDWNGAAEAPRPDPPGNMDNHL